MAEVKKPDLQILKEKSPMAVALATLLLLLFSFFIFRYFGTNKSLSDKLNGEGAKDVVVEESTDEEAQLQNKNNDESNKNMQGEQDSTVQKNLNGQDLSTWVANDIQPNTLKGKTYTVKYGDTLWEIAEGYTGNGANWVQIAQANNITYLPNGNPLIVPGQVLVIPMVN